MKQYALELFGYCVGFLSLLAKPRSPEEPIHAKFSSPGPCPGDRYETGSDHRPVAEHLVQIRSHRARLPPEPARSVRADRFQRTPPAGTGAHYRLGRVTTTNSPSALT